MAPCLCQSQFGYFSKGRGGIEILGNGKEGKSELYHKSCFRSQLQKISLHPFLNKFHKIFFDIKVKTILIISSKFFSDFSWSEFPIFSKTNRKSISLQFKFPQNFHIFSENYTKFEIIFGEPVRYRFCQFVFVCTKIATHIPSCPLILISEKWEKGAMQKVIIWRRK